MEKRRFPRRKKNESLKDTGKGNHQKTNEGDGGRDWRDSCQLYEKVAK